MRTIDSSASQSGPYTVVVTATDSGGLSTTQTFTWNVANPLPVANDDSYTMPQDVTLEEAYLAFMAARGRADVALAEEAS